MHPTINIAVKAARAAGRIIMRASEQLDRIQVMEKGQQDFVTNIDQQAEQEIIGILQASFPNHSILGEESGESGSNNHQWIIDPIDGTANFIRGLPHFSISIALCVDGRPEHGVIYDPVRDELFSASRGKGAQLNGRRLRVSPQHKLAPCAQHSSSNQSLFHPEYLQVFINHPWGCRTWQPASHCCFRQKNSHRTALSPSPVPGN